MANYVSTSGVKEYLDIDSDTDNLIIGQLATRATALIDAFTDRTFSATADSTRFFDAEKDIDGLQLLFDEDLIQITSVTNGSTSGGETVSGGKYVTLPQNVTPYYGIELLASKDITWEWTTDPQKAISIVGRWAYSLEPPEDIIHVATRLVMWLYRQQVSQEDTDRPLIMSDGTTVMPSALPRDIQMALMPYKRIIR